jgi:peptidoglycan/xylan/chitin deacetylase (PgdA/CDA1 family)
LKRTAFLGSALLVLGLGVLFAAAAARVAGPPPNVSAVSAAPSTLVARIITRVVTATPVATQTPTAVAPTVTASETATFSVTPSATRAQTRPREASPVPEIPRDRGTALALSPTPRATVPPPTFADVPILMYHNLRELSPNAVLGVRLYTVSPASFAAQLDYLVAHGFHTITFVQLLDYFEKGTPLPDQPIILTFDDAWIEQYLVAFPELHKRGLVGTFFVPTGYADYAGRTFMNWDMIREMDAAGMEFGGHTINHADLTRLNGDEVMRQLQVSKSRMEQMLGHPTIAFAYPFGDLNPFVVGKVWQAGYRAAVALCCGYRQLASELMVLRRTRIAYDDTLDNFAKQLPH